MLKMRRHFSTFGVQFFLWALVVPIVMIGILMLLSMNPTWIPSELLWGLQRGIGAAALMSILCGPPVAFVIARDSPLRWQALGPLLRMSFMLLVLGWFAFYLIPTYGSFRVRDYPWMTSFFIAAPAIATYDGLQRLRTSNSPARIRRMAIFALCWYYVMHLVGLSLLENNTSSSI
jgi:hypothetical protein